MQYTEIFSAVKIENFLWKIFDIFIIFAQNIDSEYTLEPPRRGANEYPNLCFGAKMRKIGISLHTPVLLYKSGVQGVFIARAYRVTATAGESRKHKNIISMMAPT